MKRSLKHIQAMAITAVLLLAGSPAPAQDASGITIDLSFTRSSYALGEKVGATVAVSNASGEAILISKGFSSRDFCLEIRLINPAGQLVMPLRPTAPPLESPDAPPLPYVPSADGSRAVEEVNAEELPSTWQKVCSPEDIRLYYDLSLPGQYAAQVQVSALTCKGLPCDVNDPKWSGLISSQTRFFYVEGYTEVQIVPSYWPIIWKNGSYIFQNLQVNIWPRTGGSVDDYDQSSLKLNNVPAAKVYKLYSPPKKKYYLAAFFSRQQAILGLGPVQVGQSYPARVTGKLKAGGWFGGAKNVTIVGK